MYSFHNSTGKKKDHKFRKQTYVRYFLSYLTLFSVLILGFFFIIRSEMSRQYLTERSAQASIQLNGLTESLNNDLVFLSQVDASLKNSINLSDIRYRDENLFRYYTYRELEKYASSSKLIDSIVYLSKDSGDVISTQLHVKYVNDIFQIKPTAEKTLRFDPMPYLDARSGQLIHVNEAGMEYLFYFPQINSAKNYVFFYILDTADIKRQMKGPISDEMPAMALLTKDRHFVIDVNGILLEPYLHSFSLENGIYRIDSSTSICVHTGVGNDFAMISLISNDSLTSQLEAAFGKTYMLLMILCVVGFLLILFAMRITYLPLHRLTQKVVPASDSKRSYVEQLDSAFSEAAKQNQLLSSKLDNYRLAIQKSLLDSLITSEGTEKSSSLPNIDPFFDTTSNKKIFAVQLYAPLSQLPAAAIRDYFEEVLPGKDICVILEERTERATFLINYVGTEQHKDEVLKELLNNFHEEQGYFAAISNGTDSPLDIPALYENVLRASKNWPDTPVAGYETLPMIPDDFAYPYDKLNQLSETLKENDFTSARKILAGLFETINLSEQAENRFPDFFVRSILTDMLTVIINGIGQSNIKFEAYNDLYFETMYFCRSCSYAEKAEEISANTYELIDFYEKELASRVVTLAQIKQIIGESYCQPDFSITAMADKFQISIAYMSYLIKKELNQNFSDYLWTLRLEKAKELLANSDLSVDDISTKVGYLNCSSFRRKFKQETGITPSQYRTKKNL